MLSSIKECGFDAGNFKPTLAHALALPEQRCSWQVVTMMLTINGSREDEVRRDGLLLPLSMLRRIVKLAMLALSVILSPPYGDAMYKEVSASRKLGYYWRAGHTEHADNVFSG
jgi:hypothetical protein